MNIEYKQYLGSKEWAQIKIDLYASRGRKCERCGSKIKLQIHHKTYENIFHEEPKDLEILCDTCHRKEHKKKIFKKRKSKVGKKLFRKKNKTIKLSWHDKHYQQRYNSLRARGVIK